MNTKIEKPQTSLFREVQNIINTIDNMHLSKGTTTSLEAPLNNAIKHLNRSHDVPVCNLLNAFLDQVDLKQLASN
jgi:hypothetical protein